jgi:regulator of replication initiation timing
MELSSETANLRQQVRELRRVIEGLEDENKAMSVDNYLLVQRNGELVKEVKKYQRRLRVLRKAVWLVLEPLTRIPKQPRYMMFVNHPVIAKLGKIYRMTGEEDD